MFRGLGFRGYSWDYTGDYDRAYEGGYLEFRP